MRKEYFVRHSANKICDICGFKRKSADVQKTWDGFLACRTSISPGCWYERQPLDFPPPVIPEMLPISDPRPEATDIFVQAGLIWGDSNETEFWEDEIVNWDETGASDL